MLPKKLLDTEMQFVKNGCKIRLQKKLWGGYDLVQGHDVTLTFNVATPNVAYDTSSQYGDHFYEIYLKSDFK